MGLFSKSKFRSAIPPNVLTGLGAYGQACLEARISGRGVDPAFGWDFVGPVVTGMNSTDRDRIIQEIYDAAIVAADRDHAIFGAVNLLSEAEPPARDSRYVELLDASLAYMHKRRFSSGHLTGYEAKRWIEVHGDLRSSFDHIVDVEVPEPGNTPTVEALQLGESKLLALTGPLPDGNAFYAERGQDGRYIAFSERPRNSDDPTRVRSDESYLGTFDDLEGVLRALGRMFGTAPYWADDTLQPYFPSRRE